MQQNQKNQKRINEALTYIKRIFKKNFYSESAIMKKLQDKGFGDVADDVIEIMKDLKLINDEKFASLIANNIAEFKGYGPKRIRQLLLSKGYDEFLVDNVIENLDLNFSLIALQDAKAFLRKRTFKDFYEFKRKLYSHLMYKGFSVQTIEETLEEIKEEIG